MGSTDPSPLDDEYLLTTPETREHALHTGRSVARFLAAILVIAVTFVLALHAFLGPDFDSKVASQVAPRADAENLLSEIEQIMENDRKVRHAPKLSDAGGAERNSPNEEPSLGQNNHHHEESKLKSSKSAVDGSMSQSTLESIAQSSSTLVSDRPEVVRARREITTTDWRTPLYLISMPGDETEIKRVKTNLVKLVDAHGIDAVQNLVRVVPGVDAMKWPKSLDRSVYALKSVFTQLNGDYLTPDFTLLKGLPWLESISNRDAKTGKLAPPWVEISHHVGCLFAHMTYWQTALDNNLQDAFIFESDGLNPSLLSVPVGSLGAVAKNAPSDYDLVILNQPLFKSGELFSRFADKDGNAIEMMKWRQGGVAGLGAYLFSAKFAHKVFTHVSRHGADMVDAWLIDKMCASDSVDADGNFVGFDMEGAVSPMLICYHAVGVQGTGEESGVEGGESSAAGSDAQDVVAAVGKRHGKKNKSKDADEVRLRMGLGGDAIATAAKQARAYLDAKAQEVARVRKVVEKQGIRTTQDTL